jgi:heme A synthase
MTKPVPTPQEKALRRVLLISRLDGWSIVVIAALSLLLTLVLGELLGLGISLLVLTAGIMELRGRRALKRRDPDGMKLLVRAQMFLLIVILVYCARCLGSFDAGYLQEQLIPEMRQNLLLFGINFDEVLKEADLTVAEIVPLVHMMFLVLYGTLAFVSLLFQGGLALYYRSKTGLVIEALSAPPVPPLNRPLA